MRIVSLLPSTTEIVFALGAGDDVVGVTFECDFPAEARTRRIVSTSAMPEGLTPAAIDAFVVEAMARGEDLYHLDADALADLDADVVITQDLCAVCAVDVSVVDDALTYLGCRAEVLTIDPHTLDEVLDSFVTIGRAVGREEAAAALAAAQRSELAAIAARIDQVPVEDRPRVLFLEWTEPPYAPGHWIPEMIERAGGIPLLGRPGAKSTRITWAEAASSNPDVVVVAPCGFDREGAASLAADLLPTLRAQGVLGDRPAGPTRVVAVDANASWARPGTRLIDGIRELAAILHPELFD